MATMRRTVTAFIIAGMATLAIALAGQSPELADGRSPGPDSVELAGPWVGPTSHWAGSTSATYPD